ncbi:MAG: c-type cytochrome biogenesis protein CcmI, partial [Gammaproteobacteria bacterium]|nr:c-type cytochrome biogenesis protein CcmI [Gammaproteobacteria bacterium]
MISFILISAIATIATISLLAWPLIKPRSSASYQRQTQNIHFARERLGELEQQRENNAISRSDYEALKLEIESTLAEDIDLTQNSQLAAQPARLVSNGVLIALLCGIFPFAALVLYQITGTPQALQQQPVATRSATTAEPGLRGGSQPSQQEIDSMVRSLEERLQSDPDDIEGWAMLARTYLVLGRYPEAIKANTTLLEKGGENPDVYAALADASALQAGGNLAGQPKFYIERALSLNPQHPQALWLAGLSEAQQGNNDTARKHWDQLMPLLADVPAQQDELRKIIAQTFEQPAQLQTDPQSGQDARQQT